MKYVNEILNGKKLNEFLSSASFDDVLELRTSASKAIVAEKMLRDDGDNSDRRRKYIGFLSAVIQECDKDFANRKRQNKAKKAEIAQVVEEYERFRKATKGIVGNSQYQKIIEAMELKK